MTMAKMSKTDRQKWWENATAVVAAGRWYCCLACRHHHHHDPPLHIFMNLLSATKYCFPSDFLLTYICMCNIWPENAMPAINNKRARGICKYVIFCRLIVNIIDIERNLVVGHTQMHIWRSWILTSALTWAVFLHTQRKCSLLSFLFCLA